MGIRIPDEGLVWLTEECIEALEAIPGPVQRKKRDTVVLLACQAAGIIRVSKEKLFQDERVVSESRWYMKWQHIPEIETALDTCTQAAQQWMDAEVVINESIATRQVQAAIASTAPETVAALQAIEMDASVRADHRLDAIRTHLALLNPALAERASGICRQGVPVEITEQPEQVVKLDVSELPTEILRSIANEGADRGNTESS